MKKESFNKHNSKITIVFIKNKVKEKLYQIQNSFEFQEVNLHDIEDNNLKDMEYFKSIPING